MDSQLVPSVIGGGVSLLLGMLTLYASGKWGKWRRLAERESVQRVKAEEQARVDRQSAWLVDQLQEDNERLRARVADLERQQRERRQQR